MDDSSRGMQSSPRLTKVMAAAFQMVAAFVPVRNVQGLHKNPVFTSGAEPPLPGREEVPAFPLQLASQIIPPDLLPEGVEELPGIVDLHE
jgi:hypothetical protein